MNDLAIIRERLARSLAEAPARMRGEASESLSTAAAYASLGENGSWPDIDYADRQRSHWAPALHLRRLLEILQAARAAGPGSAEESDRLSAARRALSYWLQRDPQSDNWWHNDIGAPMVMGQILLVFGDDVPAADRAAGIGILARVEIGMTGQNRAWLATIAFMRALLTDDEPLARTALGEILGEVRVTTSAEGIQPDWSFHQHGPQLYQGNYGTSFIETIAPYATLLEGTALAMSADKIETLCQMLLEGTNWMAWGDLLDYHVVGRFITCPQRSRWESRDLVAACQHLAAASPKHRAALGTLHGRLTGALAAGAGEAPSGNRHFWRSDFSVHRRAGFYASIRMSSTRTVRSEQCNGEGLRNYHMGDGVTLFLQSGQEYVGIFPVWDWRRLPGVTCRQADEPLPILSVGRHRGATEFVGGASDGADGLAALHYSLDGVSARKAWFCRGSEIVCLGAGIRSEADAVLTSINQCLARGEVTVGAGPGHEAAAAGQVYDGWRWAHHDALGYLALDGEGASLRVATQTGSWQQINSNFPDEPVSREVLSLWVDHGVAPAGGAYAYAVLLGVDAAAMPARADAPGFTVLANREDLQAVAFGSDLLQAAFHAPGALEWPGGPTVQVDRGCLVMLRRTEAGWRLYVSEPTQTTPELTATVGGRSMAVTLPSGGQAGATVSLPV